METEQLSLEELCSNAVTCGVFPGSVLEVYHGARQIFSIAAGRFAWPFWTPSVSSHTVYDLASLTKPLATSILYMCFVSDGVIGLDEKITKFLPGLPDEKQSITFRHLLNHSSGLPAYRPYFKTLTGCSHKKARNEIERWIVGEALEESVGVKTLYSDLGFMLLGFLAEKISGETLVSLIDKHVLKFFEIRDIFCGGKGDFLTQYSVLTAPSEYCKYRSRVIKAETHDMNAWVMGGFAGHAGLFATASAVAEIVIKIKSMYQGNYKHSIITNSAVREFLKVNHTLDRQKWTCGFDTPTPGNSSTGRFFSLNSIGHLGFTGTSFWHDMEKNITVVLLSNRTFPKATKQNQEAIKKFRIKVHDAVLEKLRYYSLC